MERLEAVVPASRPLPLPEAQPAQRRPQVTQNVAQQPNEPKFRKLKLSNEKSASHSGSLLRPLLASSLCSLTHHHAPVTQLIVNVPGALEALLELGWTQGTDEEGGEVLSLPAATQMTMALVRTIDAAAERLADALKAKARAESAARSRPLDPERQKIMEQMEADRRERAARGPVTVGSTAVPRGEFGAKAGASASSGSSCGGAVRCLHDEGAFSALLEECRASRKPLVVDFTATWCGPCKMVAPLFEQLAAKHQGAVIFAKVDVDEAQSVAQACGVTGMPTFQLYKAGAMVSQFSGANQQQLESMVAAALA